MDDAATTTDPALEVLHLQLMVARQQAQILGLQADLARYQHRDLLQQISALQQAIAERQKPATGPLPVIDGQGAPGAA